MEAGLGFELLGPAVELAATFTDDSVEFGQGFEVTVGDGFVDERPQPLGGLELGRVGGQVDEPQPVGNAQTFRSVPASIVNGDDDAPCLPGAAQSSEVNEDLLKQRLVDGGGQIPFALAGGRTDKRCHMQPFVAVVPRRDRLLANGCPDAADNRLQP